MEEHTLNASHRKTWLRWALIATGACLAVWQFFTFIEVVQRHTVQAQKISRSASWAGQPVGTMPQPLAASESGKRVVHLETEGTARLMQTALPWSQ